MSGLDSENGRLVLELLLSLNRQEGTTLVLVTHDPELSANADRRILLRDGRIVLEPWRAGLACATAPIGCATAGSYED